MEDDSLLIERELRILQIIVYSITFSLVVYVGVGIVLLRQGTVAPMTTPTVLPWVLAVVAVSILAAAGTVVKTIMARVRKVETASEKLTAYRSAVVVGAAMRESVGVIGLFATLITHNLLWVTLLAALAALAILTNLPTRLALRSALQENAPIS
jgi:hypothetical protein